MKRFLVYLAEVLGRAYSGYGSKRRLLFSIGLLLLLIALWGAAVFLFIFYYPSLRWAFWLCVAASVPFQILIQTVLRDPYRNPFQDWAEANREPKYTNEEISKTVERLALPSLKLLAVEGKAELGNSKLGGLPDLPEALEWPSFEGKPQAFIGQLRLSVLAKDPLASCLPGWGMLYFFYEQDQATWGDDPGKSGFFKVLFHENETGLAARPAPLGLAAEALYKEMAFGSRQESSYPDFFDREYSLGRDLAWECGLRRDQILGKGPLHRVLGFPDPLQGEMRLQCQMVSHGIILGSAEYHRDSRVEELKKGAKDWKLLLQIDSDDRTGMMWGDGGRLYYWIAEEALRKRRFEEAWMILQCH
jgi:uncharacterized protein YwqG